MRGQLSLPGLDREGADGSQRGDRDPTRLRVRLGSRSRLREPYRAPARSLHGGASTHRVERVKAAACDRLRASEADAIERRAGGKWREWKCLLDGEEVIEHEALTNVGAESLSWTGEEVR